MNYAFILLTLIIGPHLQAQVVGSGQGIEGSPLAELYFPEEQSPELDALNPRDWFQYRWSNCATSHHGNHLTASRPSSEFQGRRILLEECSPDTLYSWQSVSGLNKIKSQIGPHLDRWPSGFESEIYTHTNPLATFAYGVHALRFKLKKDVQVVLYEETSPESVVQDGFCNGGILTEEQSDKAIIARYVEKNTYGQYASGEFTYYEFILCSPQVLESWSYGTKRHYDELIKATIWYERAQKYLLSPHEYYEHYMKYRGRDLLMGFDFDGHFMSWDGLKDRLDNWQRRLIRQPNERLFLNPEISLSPESHFNTDWPIYFNED